MNRTSSIVIVAVIVIVAALSFWFWGSSSTPEVPNDADRSGSTEVPATASDLSKEAASVDIGADDFGAIDAEISKL